MFIFYCSAAKRDSQHSPEPLTVRPPTDSSFTERERESWNETDRSTNGQKELYNIAGRSYISSKRVSAQINHTAD